MGTPYKTIGNSMKSIEMLGVLLTKQLEFHGNDKGYALQNTWKSIEILRDTPYKTPGNPLKSMEILRGTPYKTNGHPSKSIEVLKDTPYKTHGHPSEL